MTDPVALDEANRYFTTKDTSKPHPEDADDQDRHSDVAEKENSTDHDHSDPGDDHDPLHNMKPTTATYHIPQTLYNANTGPKGVIADAQSYDRAKKSSFRKTFLNFTNGSYFQSDSRAQARSQSPQKNDSSEKTGRSHDEDDEDDLMEKWRQTRLKELAEGGSQKQRRRTSPSKKLWGFFKEVDAMEYLDVVDKTAAGTVVVVCIYDPESDESTAVEASLGGLAKKHLTTRFVKLHHEIADMENVTAPALIAYRNGEVMAMLTDCTAVGLESRLRRDGILVDTES